MKTTHLTSILLAAILLIRQPAHGQVIVHDPMNAQIAIEHRIEEILKLVKLIQEMKTTKDWLGNAAQFLHLAGLDELYASLQNEEVGLSRVEIATAATTLDGTSYDGNGVYKPVGEIFQSRGGEFITRPDVFKPEAAIFGAARDYDAVHEDVSARRAALRAGIQKTVGQLQAATTHAEVIKATGVLTAQSAELAATDHEETHAAEKVAVTAHEKEADAARMEKAKEQEQAVEFHEALQKFIKMLRPPSFVPESNLPAKGAAVTPIALAP